MRYLMTSSVVAAAAAAALLAGPTVAGLGVAPASSTTPDSGCEQHTTGSTGHDLTPEQAAALLQQVRELVTQLTGVTGNTRASSLNSQLRSMGITPAIATGWRQQAHDLSDALLPAISTNPQAQQLAVSLATAGYSPTPYDLKHPPTDTPATPDTSQNTTPQATTPQAATPATPTADPTPVAASTAAPTPTAGTLGVGAPSGPPLPVVAAPPIRHLATSTPAATPREGALTAALRRMQQVTGTVPQTSNPDPDPGDPGPATPSTDAGSSSRSAASGTVTGEGTSTIEVCHNNTDTSEGTNPPNGTPAAGDATSNSDQSASSDAVSGGWEQAAQDLDKALRSSTDPAAAALAAKLAAAGLDAPTGTTASDTPSRGTSSDDTTADGSSSSNDTTTDGSSEGSSSSNDTTTDGSSEGSSSSNDGSSTEGSSTDDESGAGTSASSAAQWEKHASELAADLAADTTDPTAKELSAKLADAGFTPEAGSAAEGGSDNSADGDNTHSGNAAGGDGHGQGGQDGQSATNNGGGDAEQDSGQSHTGDQAEAGDGSDGGGQGSVNGQPGSDTSSSSIDGPASPADGPAADQKPTPHPAGGGSAEEATWDKLANCESSGQWGINSGNGYDGGLQFDASTWRAYGGTQYAPSAAQASKDQQIAVAEKVRDDRGGYSAWPACSSRLGLPQ